jgi:crotonobetainyl-CoA:carnitine CoA-transferase CaiB-like acyl-CoA transferase
MTRVRTRTSVLWVGGNRYGPLDGLIVADFSRVLAGPYASMLLGDLGADVIKVERPGTGDDTRAWGPPWRDGESTYYLGLNRNKRSVVLDLADAGDRELARRLGERADVLLESFRPGLMASWGLDGDALRAANPRLVSCSVTAFGSGEAAAGLPGYDFLLQAMGGLMSVTGEPDGRPLKVGAALIDLVCGLLAASGIQAALAERERTRRGRHVEVSLMDSALTSLLNQGSAWVSGGAVPSRRGNRHPSIVPYETYERSAGPTCRPTSASRPTRRGWRTSTRSARRSRRCSRRAPPTTGSASCALPASRSDRSTASTRRSRSLPSSGSSPSTSRTAFR